MPKFLACVFSIVFWFVNPTIGFAFLFGFFIFFQLSKKPMMIEHIKDTGTAKKIAENRLQDSVDSIIDSFSRKYNQQILNKIANNIGNTHFMMVVDYKTWNDIRKYDVKFRTQFEEMHGFRIYDSFPCLIEVHF
jgi:hypothetical protein